MAWGEKYKVLVRDRFNVLWTTKIYKDGYSGVVTTLIGAGSTPLKFEFCNKSDNIMDPIKSSRVILKVWSFSMFALAELYSVEDMYHKVEIFHGENLYWTGYIDPHQCTEQYGPVPYPVNIYCIDGLTLLKNILYDDDGEYYNGRIRESQIILDILAKIGFTSFYEFCNIYEDRMADNVGDSPMDQTFPDVDIFKDMYCYEVLEKLLGKNNIIRQSYGAFYITRPTEMIGDSVAGRYFTGATTKNSVIIVPDQFIYRPDTHPSRTIRQVPVGTKMMQSPIKKVTIKQNYGNKESWLDNWKFERDTFSGSPFEGYSCKNWEKAGGVAIHPISAGLPSESEGILIEYNTYPSLTKYIKQTYGTKALTSATDVLKLEFDYLFHNLSGSPQDPVYFYIEIYSADGHYLHIGLDDIEEGIWHNYQDQVIIGDAAPEGIPEWRSYQRIIPGLPAVGNYTVKIYGAVNAYGNLVWVGIRNFRFYCTSDKILILKVKQTLKTVFGKYFKRKYVWMPQRTFVDVEEIVEKQYTKTNPINGEEVELDHILGDVVNSDIDNVLEQFAGALALGTAQIRVDTITLTGSSGQCSLLCNGLGRFAEWNASLTQTAADFVTNYAALYLPTGVVLTSSGADVIFTGTVAGFEFYGETSVGYQSGTLDGTVVYTTPAYALFPSESWSRRGTVEMKELLQIICDEIAEQYSRPKQLIQMPIMDMAGPMAINLLGNIQDTINTLDGKARVFVINRGEFDVRNRMWMLDLFEIGTKDIVEEEPGEGPYTADNMVVTVDSTVITVDSL